MAEALLRARLQGRAPDVRVASAGLLFDGRPAEPNAVRAMDRWGIDLSGFRSQTLSTELLAGASMILGMERAHVREVATLDSDLFPVTFPLRELVAEAAQAGPRHQGTLRDWAVELGRERRPTDYLLDDPASEVADPMGGSRRTFRACADELARLIDDLVELAWPAPVSVEGVPLDSSPPLGGPR